MAENHVNNEKNPAGFPILPSRDGYRKGSNDKLWPLLPREVAIISGSLLGDGCSIKTNNSVKHKMSHGKAQKVYLEWKYSLLPRLTQSTKPPHLENRSNPERNGYVFTTASGYYLVENFELFYKRIPNKPGQIGNHYRKTITQELIDKLPMDPYLLTIWYLDDGSARTDSYAGRFNTQCFTLDENQLLQTYLKKWGINSAIAFHSTVKKTYYISIPAKEFPKLVKIIEDFVHSIQDMSITDPDKRKVMAYKLSEKFYKSKDN